MTTILVAEDEPLMRERLLAMLEVSWPEAKVVLVAENGNDAWDGFLEHEPDVCFLDIRMPGLSGLEVAAKIGQEAHVVFVTAYDQYAVQAFDAGAVDYLLKPVQADRLARAIDRIRAKLATPPADMAPVLRELKALAPEPERMKWIRATVGKQIKLIDVNDVLFFQSDTKYTRIVLPDFEALVRIPLKDLVGGLDPERFWQIHRSTLIAVNAIAAVTRDFRGRQIVAVKGHPQKLEVSRSYTHLFKGM
jgi:DNA-binding LytR/AlgR family response regulator